MIKRLKNMQECLMNCVQGQLGDLSSVDAKELGEAVDMIKDFSEAIYYSEIAEAMEEKDKYRDMEYEYGRMYYDGDRRYRRLPEEREPRDYREGRSPMTRKMYMEHKELHQDKAIQMQDLEKYMQELTHDLMEMIDDSTPEEKQVLRTKLTALASKIV